MKLMPLRNQYTAAIDSSKNGDFTRIVLCKGGFGNPVEVIWHGNREEAEQLFDALQASLFNSPTPDLAALIARLKRHKQEDVIDDAIAMLERLAAELERRNG